MRTSLLQSVLACCRWPKLGARIQGAALWQSLCLVGLLFLFAPSWAGAQPAAGQNEGGKSTWASTLLAQKSVDRAAIKVGYLLDANGELSIEDVRQRDADFQLANPYQNFDLGGHGVVWLRLRLALAPSQVQALAAQQQGSELWVVDLPAPLLHDVRFYYTAETGDGRLIEERAGTVLPNKNWGTPSSTPYLGVRMHPQQTTDVWVRVQHPMVTQLPVHVKESSQFMRDTRFSFWLVGLVLGALLFLTLYVLLVAGFFRDATHIVFGFYLWTTLAALFSYSGLNAYFLWSSAPWWTEVASGFWMLVTCAFGAWFVDLTLLLKQRHQRLHMLSMGLVALNVLCIPVYFFADRSTVGALVVGIMVLLSYTVNTLVGAQVWREGNHSGRTIAVYFFVLLACALWGWAAVIGQLHVYWYKQTFVSIFLLIGLPALLADLNFKMRRELANQIRMQGLRTHDALTDTLREHVFLARVRDALTTPARRKKSAIVMVEVSNLPYMSEHFPQDLVEQTLLRAAVKTKRVFADLDSIGRVGTHRFALLIDENQPEQLNRLCVELIASGLMATKVMRHEITIVFHFAVAVLGEYEGNEKELLQDLHWLCDAMSVRTQKPIRHLTPDLQAKARAKAATPSKSGAGNTRPLSAVVDSRFSTESGFVHTAGDSQPTKGPGHFGRLKEIKEECKGQATQIPDASTRPPFSR